MRKVLYAEAHKDTTEAFTEERELKVKKIEDREEKRPPSSLVSYLPLFFFLHLFWIETN